MRAAKTSAGAERNIPECGSSRVEIFVRVQRPPFADFTPVLAGRDVGSRFAVQRLGLDGIPRRIPDRPPKPYRQDAMRTCWLLAVSSNRLSGHAQLAA